MKSKIGQWLLFGVIFSAIPLIIVLIVQDSLNSPVEKRDYVPDLILVSFAIVVNALGNAYGRNTKNEKIEEACLAFSLIAMSFCIGFYFSLIGHAISLNQELLKLEIIAKENPELMWDIVSDIKSAFEESNNNINWLLYICWSLGIAIISAVFGVVMEIKQYYKEKKERINEENEKINAMKPENVISSLEQFLKTRKNESPADYQELVSGIYQLVEKETEKVESCPSQFRKDET